MTGERLTQAAKKLRAINAVKTPGREIYREVFDTLAAALEGVAEAHRPVEDDPRFAPDDCTTCADHVWPCPEITRWPPLCDVLLGPEVDRD